MKPDTGSTEPNDKSDSTVKTTMEIRKDIEPSHSNLVNYRYYDEMYEAPYNKAREEDELELQREE
jgi:hypothetical protein